jgi:site-specific DNA-methyltransferase (adenine-specific)
MTQAYNIDCMEAMAQMPDKAFDLAIVDPPYGINIGNGLGISKGKKHKFKRDKKWEFMAPDESYFNELYRISKNQIIWGANHYKLPVSKGWIFWDKCVPIGVTFSDGELAWTNFDIALRKVTIAHSGFTASEDKIHPTQKPIKLYEWLLKNYAKDGWRILDTHLGSGSSRIAADKMGFDFVGYELDTEYFEAQEKRFAQYKSQLTLGL